MVKKSLNPYTLFRCANCVMPYNSFSESFFLEIRQPIVLRRCADAQTLCHNTFEIFPTKIQTLGTRIMLFSFQSFLARSMLMK